VGLHTGIVNSAEAGRSPGLAFSVRKDGGAILAGHIADARRLITGCLTRFRPAHQAHGRVSCDSGKSGFRHDLSALARHASAKKHQRPVPARIRLGDNQIALGRPDVHRALALRHSALSVMVSRWFALDKRLRWILPASFSLPP